MSYYRVIFMLMNSPFDDPDVVRIATLKRTKAIETLTREIGVQQQQKRAELASRGLSQSGAMVKVMQDLGVKRLEGVVYAHYNGWKEALAETGYSITSTELRTIADEALKYLEHAPKQLEESLKHQARGMENVVEKMGRAIEQDVYAIRTRFTQDSEIDIAKAKVAERTPARLARPQQGGDPNFGPGPKPGKGVPNKLIFETAFERYEIKEVIGEGGAGRVRRAIDSVGVDVAVKILDPKLAVTNKRKRFQNEILFCTRTQHSNIVKVLDSGVTPKENDSTPFYVMPIFDRSLRKLLPTITDYALSLRYFDQILTGVEAAHLQRVVHRDLKPENILFDAKNDLLVIADFGVAHFTDEELYAATETKDGDRLANFQYAAPEQKNRGQKVDFPADIFALGLMLNELFTGQVPHGVEYKTVASVASEYTWIDGIVASMIQQDPDRRPDSIDAIKRQFVVRNQEYVTRQRLSKIQNTVIAIGIEDDPLAIKPPHITGCELKPRELTLILNVSVGQDWQQAFWEVPYAMASPKGPSGFVFKDNRAIVYDVPDSYVQSLIDQFKTWLPQATEIYRRRREQTRREKANLEREAFEAERQELERLKRLRENIRL